ncbi:hydrogenase maturation nickel metallochaperone HypA [Synechococcus sp. Nb3U1]|uniref:hydrogenase maturation nickel metallochaperone HypA n=1 Tax=Synechococcus sp. Nb3U1 TaxID=1914529 RepID=UPI001F33B484|nr:hydrogenase maturation nickel metallochaperone HypA [Synechococcus sp. Nb3U1]MCF2971539.1 hydrogenase maturation nickel metallochaperone HypA [Synechococcus sp. Nb3U1]
MHETDMTRALIQTLRDWWESQPERPRITHVHLIVGRFTCVEPVSLEFAYAVQTQATFLEGSRLVIRETPLIAYCYSCKQEYKPEIGQRYACPTCGSPMEEIRSGRELKIDQIECLSEVSQGE